MVTLEKPPTPEKEKPPTRITPVRVLVPLVAVAALVALFFGVRWGLALGDDDLKVAAARDSVLVDAQQAAININTLDYRTVAKGLDLWEQTSTGPLLDEFKSNRDGYEKLVTSARRVTEATVVDGAVAELDLRAGTARVIVGLDVKVIPEGADPVVTRQRLHMEMTRTDQGWKASRVAPVREPAS
jgi:Mce-associated membrane protein